MRNSPLTLALTVFAATACSPSSLVDVPSPSSVVPIGDVTTPAGAARLYAFAVTQFAISYGGGDGATVGVDSYVSASGLLSDELMRTGTRLVNPIVPTVQVTIDERTMNATQPAGAAGLYDQLQRSRVEARQAREALSSYAPALPKALQAQLYANEGYSIVMLAEGFCDGIPLSIVPLNGDPNPSRGYSTDELFVNAAALFDSAIAIGADSARFVNFARIGKARALLGRGPQSFAAAASAVQAVPTDFIYNVEFSSAVPRGSNWIASNPWIYNAVGGEGINGLNWIADPRTGVPSGKGVYGVGLPAKYSRDASGALDPSVAWPDVPMPVASGVEARLIEAEADLYAGGTNWLAILNALRAACVGAAACAPVPSILAGRLAPLADPGTAPDPNARIKLLMKERAMWLFLTGHREGDLRRLAHWYPFAFSANTLWPVGEYVNAGSNGSIAPTSTNLTSYGADVLFLPDPAERQTNPVYAGCASVAP